MVSQVGLIQLILLEGVQVIESPATKPLAAITADPNIVIKVSGIAVPPKESSTVADIEGIVPTVTD